jgi:SAM-dependent methyltransferase
VTPIPRARHARELLDDAGIDQRALEASLDDVAAVNRWLGGTRAVLRAIDELVATPRPLQILDVGCGHADVPLAIARRAARTGAPAIVVGVDRHPATVSVAHRRTRGERVAITRADALALPFADASFDVAVLSLTLHHLDEDEHAPALRELGRVARLGIVVNELHRTRANHLGARLLAATLWRRRPITRHDGPLSVLRAFTPAELQRIARAAGFPLARVRRRFFYRLVLVGRTSDRAVAASTD